MIEPLFLNVAGFVIEINFSKTEWPFLKEQLFKDRIYDYYRGFVLEKHPLKTDFWIDFKFHKGLEIIVQNKRKKIFINFYEHVNKKRIEAYYHLSDEQFKVIIRKILQIFLAQNKGMIIHASSVLVDDQAYIFLGKSGAGKSTAMEYLSYQYPALGDDTAILRKEGNEFYLYQTPFRERNEWIYKNSKRYKIGKIFFLRKSENFMIKQINNKDLIIDKFFAQFLTERETLKKYAKIALKFIDSFNSFYFLFFGESRTKLIKLVENSKGS